MSKQRDRIRRVNAKRPPPLRMVVEYPAADDAAARERAIGILWRLLDELEAEGA